MLLKIELSDQQLEEIIENWFALDTFEQRGYAIRKLLPRLMHFMPSTISDSYSSVIRHRVWNVLRHAFVLNVDSFKGPNKPNAADLHEFALLPLNTNLNDFTHYKSEWMALAEAIISLDGARSLFCQRTVQFLAKLKNKPHNEVVACLIDLEDAEFPAAAPVPIALLDYVDTLCTASGAATTIKDLNVVAFALQSYTKRLDGARLIRMYNRLKDTFASLESTVMSMRCDMSACNEFKNIVANHMRTQKPTQHLVRLLIDESLKKELTAMQKADSAVDFVVIPSVWKFNPDRLTDQQRDKMKERRADIPALYNDTSQSQESRSIKPWTPQKLVIQEADAEPMIIEVESASGPITQPDEQKAASPIVEIDDAEPLPLSQDSNSSHGSSTSSMAKKLTNEELEEKRKKRIQSALKNIQIDIVDSVFTVQSRTRTRNSNCNSPVPMGRDGRTNQLKAKETDSQSNSINTTPKRKRSAKIALTDTDASDHNEEDTAKEHSDLKRRPLKTRAQPRKKTGDNDLEESRKNADETEVINSENQPLRRPNRASEPNQASESNEASNKKSRRSLAKKLKSAQPDKPTSDKAAEKDNEKTDKSDSNNADAESNKPKIGSKVTKKLLYEDVSQKLQTDSQTQMTNDLSTEAIEASQQSPCTSISGRRSIRRSAKPITPLKVKLNATTKSPTTQTMDTLPMDTECAEEVMDIVQTIVKPKPVSPKTIDAPILDTQDQAIAEAETEPNTQMTLTDSMINISSEKLLEPVDDIPLSPIPADGIVNDEANKSILSSPQSNDLEDRNAEFLNNTLNISPIHDVSVNSEPSTPIRHVTELRPKEISPKLNESLRTIQLTETPPSAPISAASIHHLPPQSSVTPLQMRYQANILSSTPTIMSAASSNHTITTSANNSPSSLRFTQLKGRGAQLLNMINIKKKDLPKPDFTETILTAPEPTESLDSSLPLGPARDLLTFSKTLPPPTASPSFSILKRKFVVEPESMDDFESPASKRKRVSFHDPPVSSTKEYIGHADEHPDRNVVKVIHQSLNIGNGGSPADQRMRHTLRRKSRADSMVEIAKFGKPKMAVLPGLAVNTSPSTLNNTSIDMEPLKWDKSTASEHEDESAPPIITLDDLDELITPSPLLQFNDKAAVIQHVVDEYALDDVLAKFEMNANTARVLTRHLATIMNQDATVRSTTLDQLAENHPLEFLEYAVRGNYSSAVCAKLDPDVLISHVAKLAKTDESVRSSLLSEVTNLTESDTVRGPAMVKLQSAVLNQLCESAKTEESEARTKLMDAVGTVLAADESTSSMTDEQMRLMMQLFNRPMSDNQICECIEMFSRNRKRN